MRWRIYPKDAMAGLKDLRTGTVVNRNRSMAWMRALERPSAEQRIPLWVRLHAQGDALCLTLTDADG